jgi:hypothetical protein
VKQLEKFILENITFDNYSYIQEVFIIHCKRLGFNEDGSTWEIKFKVELINPNKETRIYSSYIFLNNTDYKIIMRDIKIDNLLK